MCFGEDVGYYERDTWRVVRKFERSFGYGGGGRCGVEEGEERGF